MGSVSHMDTFSRCWVFVTEGTVWCVVCIARQTNQDRGFVSIKVSTTRTQNLLRRSNTGSPSDQFVTFLLLFHPGEEMSTSLFCYRSALLFWLTEWSPVSHCGETSAQPLEKVRNRVQPGPGGVQEHRRHHRVSLSVELFLLLWQMVMGGLEDPGEPVKWYDISHNIWLWTNKK